MREIAEAAGVSKSLLHYHFRSKEHLFVEVEKRAYERIANRVAGAIEPIASGGERGLRAFDVFMSALRETDDLRIQAELWAGALSDEKLRVHVLGLHEFLRNLLTETIASLLDPELDRMGMTREQVGDLFWVALNGIAIESSYGGSGDRIDRAVQALRTLIATALRAAPSGAVPSPGAGKAGSTRARRR